MHVTNKWVNLNITQLAVEMAVLIVCFPATYAAAAEIRILPDITNYLWVAVVYGLCWILAMSTLKMYDITTFYYPDRILKSIIKAAVFSSCVVLYLLFLLRLNDYSRVFILTYVSVNVAALTIERFLFQLLFNKFKGSFAKTPKQIVVGSLLEIEKYHYFLNKTAMRCNIVGYVFLDSLYPPNMKALGELKNFDDIIRNNIVDEVVFALPKTHLDQIGQYTRVCDLMGITVKILADFFDFQNSRYHISMLGPVPMITLYSVPLNPMSKAVKRAVDLLGSMVGLLVTGMLCVVIVPLIMAESPGPAFFSQTRVGLNGRTFKIYKFRTMCTNSEALKKDLAQHNEYEDGRIFKIRDDPRITRMGKILRKTSLDEFPQFLNVFLGQMSLVGTRPPLIEEVMKYDTPDFRRLSIKPGITGMWQVSGRSNIREFKNIVQLDTYYIDNWSLLMDFKILLKTVFQVFSRQNAY